MLKTTGKYIALILLLAFVACKVQDSREHKESNSMSISRLKFIGEFVFPAEIELDGQLIGGFSGIDFVNDNWIIICDATEAPVRFYNAALDYDSEGFHKVLIESSVEILDSTQSPFAKKTIDPEALRYDPQTKTIIWTSEGNIANGIDPLINEIHVSGNFIRSFELPKMFKPNLQDSTIGPRHNGSFEGLSNSIDGLGYWAAMEHPLKQDGEAPIFGTNLDSPVRFSFIDKKSGTITKQFAYELEPVARKGSFMVNGVSEILEYDQNRFLVIERSFAMGHSDGGNNIFIYKVDASQATDVLNIASLRNGIYRKAKKNLLFDFETIRQRLSSVSKGFPKVDNIEGISFGPKLANGHRSIVVVADNNFNAFGPQLNQFIAFEVIP